MKFRENSDVRTADGEKIGNVERVVLDPQTKEVTHLVIQKGFLFTEDKILPLDLVDTTIDSVHKDEVWLRKTSDDLMELPDFQETHYLPINEEPYPEDMRQDNYRQVYWYPPLGSAYYPGLSYAIQPEATYATPVEEKNIPEGTVALKEGAKVISADNTHIGDVEKIFTDSQTGRATHLLISRGLLLQEKKIVPTHWIRELKEEDVHLGVTLDFINNLPEYEEA